MGGSTENERVPELAITLENLAPLVFPTPLGEFRIVKTIGHGSYGRVKLVVNSITDEKFAVKIIRRNPIRENLGQPTAKPSKQVSRKASRIPMSKRTTSNYPEKEEGRIQAQNKRAETLKVRILREANLCKLLRHANIVALHDFRVSMTHYYLFFDHVDGCQLADRIGPKGCSEHQATIYFAQIVNAIAYCHRYSIVHRDIKIENILVDKFDRVKLIDFGLANFYDPNRHLKTSCGTIPYTSPEILRGSKYIGPEVDIWSLGVVLYTMVTGTLPFGDPRYRENYFKILRSEVRYPHTMSPECRDLISFCLHPDPEERFTITQIQEHELLVGPYEQLGISITPVQPVPIPNQLDANIIVEMAGCLLSTPEIIKHQLNLELKMGWRRPTQTEEVEEASTKVLCRNCPLVSVYHLIATHPERETIRHMAELEKVRLRTAQSNRLRERIALAQRSSRFKKSVAKQRKPVNTFKSQATTSVKDWTNTCFGDVEVRPEETCKKQTFIKSRPCSQKNRRSLVNLGHEVVLNQIPSVEDDSSSSIAEMLSTPHTCRRLTLVESVQSRGKVVVGRGDLDQVNLLLLSTLERLEIAHESVRDTKRCAYIAQYCPSLSQNDPSVLDMLSCSFSLELVELSPFFPKLHLDKLPILAPLPLSDSSIRMSCHPLKKSSSRPHPLFCILISPIGGAIEKLPTMQRLINLELTSTLFKKPINKGIISP
ncbi:Serine/threonine-protein kinase [Entomophthora muscae]|uniref:Serine/threonine-protein kinase n=1 Tax=Entomophthora muscae TaxID=34485 RepID=A0ACC2RL90_9FUNG|nr:Serine/threonine-protein kinase [Entomophthora muscae]